MNNAAVTRDELGTLLFFGVNKHLLPREVVLWLSNIHPIPWQFHLVQVTLRGHLRENFSLNRAGSLRNSLNHVSSEKVETSIDLVTNESLWLLNELLDLSVFFSNDNSILAWIFHSGHDNSALLAVVFVEGNQLVQWVFADNVRIENEEESLMVLLPNDLLSQADWTRSAQRLVFERE